MFREKIDPTSKEKPSMCQICRFMPCEKLHSEELIVLTGFTDTPMNCPKRIKDEREVERRLLPLDASHISTMMGKVWGEHNHFPRYVDMRNLKAEETRYMLSHFRQNKCAILSRSEMPEFKPWKLFGFFANFDEHSTGMPPVLDRGNKKKPEKTAFDTMAEEALVEKLPLKIINLRWEHVDDQLKNDSPDSTSEGDSIKLLADIENYVEGAGVDFFVSDMSSGTKKQIRKIHTNCKSNAANVEWVVDVSKAGEKPDIIFEVEARNLLRGPCEIKIENEITFQITLPIDPNDEKSQDDTIRLFSTDDAKTYNQTQTVKDDKKTDDKFLTLDFPDVDTTLKYSLEVDTGAEGKIYFQFENMTVEEVLNG